MLKRISIAAALTIAVMLTTSASANVVDVIESVYTDLSPDKCRTIELDEEIGGTMQECPGIGGYKLLVVANDARTSVTVVNQIGKEFPLEFWNVITHGFSDVGNKAEWRVVKQGNKVQPLALIIRVNANEDPNNPEKKTSYLAVAKFGLDAICVTDKIKPSPRMNEEARLAADSSRTKPCLK